MESCREGAHNTRERLLRSRQGPLLGHRGRSVPREEGPLGPRYPRKFVLAWRDSPVGADPRELQPPTLPFEQSPYDQEQRPDRHQAEHDSRITKHPARNIWISQQKLKEISWLRKQIFHNIDEMMGHHAKVDHDSIDEMMKWITHMVDTAYVRILRIG